MADNGWYGVDLDGTLAFYDGWKGPGHIGHPIPLMLARVKEWIADGKDVRIFTARVANLSLGDEMAVRGVIRDWCYKNIGKSLPVTCQKDMGMIVLYDDRCRQVEENTGVLVGGE